MLIVDWISIGMVVVMLVFIVGIIIERTKTKFGMSLNLLRYTAVGLLIPATVILGIQKIISSDAVATLLGAVAGYMLSNIEKKEEKT